MPKKREFKCETCGNERKTSRGNQRYCSTACRWKAWDKTHPRVKA